MRIRYGKKEDGRLIKKAEVYTADEHRINAADVDGDAAWIVARLRENGFESYIVGGAVRDLMLGRKPKDFDIVTAATPARIKRIFRNSRIIGRRFRLVHVYFGLKTFEVSTFRSLKDGLTSNTYGDIEEDVLRRDFSLNALFYDPEKRIVVDYVGGMNDIRARRIRPIIPASVIFKDDPVRMIRAVKYAATTGFALPWLLLRRIRREAPLLENVSASRRTEELTKIINSPYAAHIVKQLQETGLYSFLQAEASRLLKTSRAFTRSYYQSLEALETLNEQNETAPPGSRAAALVRDYLEETCDWEALKQNVWEGFKDAFFTARRFILPMNPPRVELEHALRLIFAVHGIDVKKVRLFESRRPDFAHTAAAKNRRPGNALPAAPAPAGGADAAPVKKRRRRRKKDAAPAAPQNQAAGSGSGLAVIQ
jgi:poly(A) polymerase